MWLRILAATATIAAISFITPNAQAEAIARPASTFTSEAVGTNPNCTTATAIC
jgi:hypothetical protein